MGRYTQDVGIDQPFDVVSLTMEDYLYHNHFIRTDWSGEPVYSSSKDNKVRYLRWSYSCGILHLEAWRKNAFGKEADLDGSGWEKQEYKESLERLIEKLRDHPGDRMETGYIGQDPLPHREAHEEEREQPVSYAQPQYEIPLKIGRTERGGTGDAQVRMFGFLALFFSILFPAVGMVFAIIGLTKCKQEVIVDEKIRVTKILCIAGLVIALLRLFLIPFASVFLTLILSFL